MAGQIRRYRINLTVEGEGFKSIGINAYDARDAEYIATRVLKIAEKKYDIISIRPEVEIDRNDQRDKSDDGHFRNRD